MQYPQSKDYIAVLQHPRQAFTVPELQRAVLDEDMGLPFPIEGSSAAVFRATIRQKGYALRCYTRDEASTPERYAALSRFVTSAPTLSTEFNVGEYGTDVFLLETEMASGNGVKF